MLHHARQRRRRRSSPSNNNPPSAPSPKASPFGAVVVVGGVGFGAEGLAFFNPISDRSRPITNAS